MFHRKPKRAAVLGCGPAGLFAAHALMRNGWGVSIYSNKRRSEMYGAQYLHRPIPGLSVADPVEVDYRLIGGSAEQYRSKVYGNDATARSSVETLDSKHQGWDIREAYFNAWERYFPIITDLAVTPQVLGVYRAGEQIESPIGIPLHDFQVIVNSIPLDRLCYYPEVHRFEARNVWAIGDAPERGIFAPYRAKPNTVECNASRDVGWYRASNVFGYTTVEWPDRSKPPLQGVSSVTKPIRTSCTCYATTKMQGYAFVNVGRYGTWTKGVLAHDAYEVADRL